MITEEQIKKLKKGDPLIIHGEYVSQLIEGDIAIKYNVTIGGVQVTGSKFFHPSCVSLPSEYKTVVDARDVFRNMSEGEKEIVNNFLVAYCSETKKQEEMRKALKKLGIDLTNIRPKYDPCRLFKEGDIVKPVERYGRKNPKLNYKAEYTVTSSEDDYGAVGVEYFNGDMTVCVSVPFYWLELVTPVEELDPYTQGDGIDGQVIYKNGDFYAELKNAKEAEIVCKLLNAEWRKEHGNDWI